MVASRARQLTGEGLEWYLDYVILLQCLITLICLSYKIIRELERELESKSLFYLLACVLPYSSRVATPCAICWFVNMCKNQSLLTAADTHK